MRILTTAAPIALAAALAAGGAFAQSTAPAQTDPAKVKEGESVQGEGAVSAAPNQAPTTAANSTEPAQTKDGENAQMTGAATGDNGTLRDTADDRDSGAYDREDETDPARVKDGEAAASAGTAAADDAAKIEVGMLTCDLTQSSNNIVLSSSEYLCELEASDGYNDATYIASIDMVGLDLKSTNSETLKWAVLTTSDRFETAMLEGDYVGASASAAVGAGAGVRAMVGGDSESVSLQPLSVSGSTDSIGASLGLEQMELRRVN